MGKREPEIESGRAGDSKAAGPRASRPNQPLRRATVLLVEDDSVVLKFIAFALRRQGYRVLEATNGHEGLRVFDAHHASGIELVISDIAMPGMNGVEMAARIQASKPYQRILFVSAYSYGVLACRCGQLAASAFLEKPFSAEILAAKVKEMISDSSSLGDKAGQI